MRPFKQAKQLNQSTVSNEGESTLHMFSPQKTNSLCGYNLQGIQYELEAIKTL